MNIVLSDRSESFINMILEHTDWTISLLIIDDFSHNKESYAKEPRIVKMLTLSELMNYNSEQCMDLNVLSDFKYTFPICDYGSRRIQDDYQFSHYAFYSGVNFWCNYLKDNVIDLCIITNHPHGFQCDYLLQEVAKTNHIPCYNVFPHNAYKLALYSALEDDLIPILEEDEQEYTVVASMHETAHYAKKRNFDANFYEGAKLISRIAYKVGGAFLFRCLWLIRNGVSDIHYRKCSLSSYIRAYFQINRTLKSVKKHYTPVSSEDKFVIYFLHFEPEAVITSFASVMDSQLMYIKLLSTALPKGWKLYVKEHPDTYKLNKWAFEHNIPCAPTFITPYFYETIANMPNVQLIDYHIPASELLERAKAISTIAGTITLEGIINKKPIILFDSRRLAYRKCKDFLFVKDTESCAEVYSKIENGFVPDYSDYDEIQKKYIVDDTDGYKLLILKKIKEKLNSNND